MGFLSCLWGLGFGVWGLGFGVWGLGFGVWGLGFGVWGLGFGVWGLGFGVWGLGFGVWGLGFGVWGFGFRVWGLGFGGWGGLGWFGVWGGLGFGGVWGLGFGDYVLGFSRLFPLILTVLNRDYHGLGVLSSLWVLSSRLRTASIRGNIPNYVHACSQTLLPAMPKA